MSVIVCGVKKKRHVKRTLFIILFILIAIIVAASIFIAKNVNPVILKISNERIRAISQDAVSASVLEIMATKPDEELVSIVRDEDDKIKSVEIDADTITSMAQDITIAAQKKINEAGIDGIKIPLGSLSGVTLFTGLGPDVNIKIYLVGSTKTRIVSVFSESGINQTLHRVYLDISGSVAVAVPGISSTIDTQTQVLMSEMIIVGEVPPTYLRAVNVGDMLDLIVN
ncbi:MAG: sporulation protein YunB [Clostridiales bacterium]|nr:sporulation protein YunB [Clostridiales bacterium]